MQGAEPAAALIWPARIQWLRAETVRALVEAHGAEPAPLLRPAFEGEPSWPVLLPLPTSTPSAGCRPI